MVRIVKRGACIDLLARFVCIALLLSIIAALESTDIARTVLKRQPLDIDISNAYTMRSGPVGENMYQWDSTRSGSSARDMIIDVAYPATIQVLQHHSSCSYRWGAQLSDQRKAEPLFDGLFFKSKAHQHLSGAKTTPQRKDSSESIFSEGKYGHKVAVKVRSQSSWVFNVTETCDLDSVVSTTSSRVVHFMPIRREIRSLLPQDRGRFLDAFHSLWRVPTEVGRQDYGLFYLDIHDLNNLHRQNAGNRDSDHFHEGLGFLSQHLKLTRRLEESLQSIDPWLAAHYWDPTIDMALVSSNQVKHQLDTILWTSHFFGEPCPFDEASFQFNNSESWKMAAIIGGRWSLTQVPKIGDGTVWGDAAAEMLEQGISVPHNAYGYLRSPWNLNPSPFVTRFMTKSMAPEWATCDNIANGITKSLKGDLSEGANSLVNNFAQFWSYRVQFPPQAHAGLHDYIGGYYIDMDLDKLKKTVDSAFPHMVPEKAWVAFTHQWSILIQKGLWRSWLIEYPQHCEDGATLTDCRPSCSSKFPRSVVGEFIMLAMLNMDAPRLPYDQGWWSTKFDIRHQKHGTKVAFLKDVQLEQRFTKIGECLCDNLGITVKGENFESSGVLDPTFWLIHGTSDRLFQMAMFALNKKLKQFQRSPISVDELADAIWPQAENATYCGSIASCLTCFQITTWLSEEIEHRKLPTCLDTDGGKNLIAVASSAAVKSSTNSINDVENKLTHDCCLGHGMNDQLYTSFSTIKTRAMTDGPTNKDILYLLQSDLGPQWDKGGTVIFEHFRYDHCQSSTFSKTKKRRKPNNPIYTALKMPNGIGSE